MPHAIDITGPITADGKRVFTPEALRYVGELEARFGPVRTSLLERRRQRDPRPAHRMACTPPRPSGATGTSRPRRRTRSAAMSITPAERKMITRARLGLDVFAADSIAVADLGNIVNGQARCSTRFAGR
jgi:hypothetical protein